MFATVVSVVATRLFCKSKKTRTVQDPVRLMDELKQAVVIKAEAREYIVSRNLFDNNHERCLWAIPEEADRMKLKRRERVMTECLAQLHSGYCEMQRKIHKVEIQSLLQTLVFEVNQKLDQKAKKQKLLDDISRIAPTKSLQRHLLHLTLTHELSDAVAALAYRKNVRTLKRTMLLQLTAQVEAQHLASYRMEVANQFQEVMKEIVARPFVLRFAPVVQDTSRPVYDPMAFVLYFNMFAGLFSLFHLVFFLFTATRRISKLFNHLDSILASPEDKTMRLKRRLHHKVIVKKVSMV